MSSPWMLQTASDVCTPGKDPWTYLLNFEFIKAFSCTYFDSVGLLVTGLLVFGAVGVSLYVTTDSVAIPVVLVLVVGGAIIPLVAGPGVQMAVIVLLISGAGAATYLWYRFTR